MHPQQFFMLSLSVMVSRPEDFDFQIFSKKCHETALELVYGADFVVHPEQFFKRSLPVKLLEALDLNLKDFLELRPHSFKNKQKTMRHGTARTFWAETRHGTARYR